MHLWQHLATYLAALLLAACASVSVLPLSTSRAQILIEGTSCNAARVHELTLHQAAAHTIRSGYDRFIILSSDKTSETKYKQYGGTQRTYWVTPFRTETVTTPGFTTSSTESKTTVQIQMFRLFDYGASEGLDPIEILGEDWETKAHETETSVPC